MPRDRILTESDGLLAQLARKAITPQKLDDDCNSLAGRWAKALALHTPPVDNFRPFANQRSAIAAGMRACDQLLDWVQRNQTMLAAWPPYAPATPFDVKAATFRLCFYPLPLF